MRIRVQIMPIKRKSAEPLQNSGVFRYPHGFKHSSYTKGIFLMDQSSSCDGSSTLKMFWTVFLMARFPSQSRLSEKQDSGLWQAYHSLD